MFTLISRLISRALTTWQGRVAAMAGTTLAAVELSDVISLDWLRGQAIEIAPGSDAAALEEAARTAGRMLGLEGDEILWPRRRDGAPITPKYLTIDLSRGRAWYHGQYYSRKSVRSSGRRGFGKGTGAGMRRAVQTKQLAG